MSLFSELKRRNVLRIMAAYLMVGWLLLQVADIVFNFIGVPDWVGKLLITLLVLGFPPVIAVAWIFELTPDGIRREKDLPSDHENHTSARRLDYITVGAVVILAFITFYQQFQLPGESDDAQAERAEPVQRQADAEPEPSPPPRIRRMNPPPLEADPRSVAVLPFANRSAEEENRYFVDGVHDDLLTQLARIGDLTVISRTSVMEYRDTTKNMKQIGEELGVANILEGAVQRSGKRIRVNAQLIDADTDKHLWADTFDRELTADNLFDIQADIARAIAGALASTLSEDELDKLGVGNAPTHNQEAYDLYLQARALGSEMSGTAPSERIKLLEQALALDPDFVLAQAEMGFQYGNWYWFHSRDSAHKEKAHGLLQSALAREPDNPQILWYWADHIYHAHLDYDRALEVLAEAEKGLPNYSDLFNLRGWILRRQGKFEAAIDAFLRSVQLDPLDETVLFDLAYTHAAIDDMQGFWRWRDRLLTVSDDPEVLLTLFSTAWSLTGKSDDLRGLLARVDGEQAAEPNFVNERFRLPFLERDWAQAQATLDALPGELLLTQRFLMPGSLGRARIAWHQGDREAAANEARKALTRLESFLEHNPDDVRALLAKGLTLALLGQDQEAISVAGRAIELYPRSLDALASDSYLYQYAKVLAYVGESGQVAGVLREILESDGTPMQFEWIVLDPAFDRHREHPAFQALAREFGAGP